MSLEYRRVNGLHVRVAPDRKEGRVIADVMIYNKVDDYRTSFAPSAFEESLRDHLPKMLWAHNMMEPIGRWIDADNNNQRLRMVGELDLDMVTTPDGRELDIPAVPMAHRAWTQMQKRTIDQFSVGFLRLEDSPHRSVRGATQIDKAWLDEASPVLVGSVPGTRLVGVRSANTEARPAVRAERRSIFLFTSPSVRGRVTSMTTEERANPTGYNQYKHMAGSSSPSAQKALKDGPRALDKNVSGGPSPSAVGQVALDGGLKYADAKIVADVHGGDTKDLHKLSATPSDVGQALLDGGMKFSDAKMVSDKVAKAQKAELVVYKPAKTKAEKEGLVSYDKGGKISKVDAAAKMYGTGSKQHLAAKKKFG